MFVQVKGKDGKYIDVPYRPDAVLVNIGAQIEHWTNAKYPATVTNLMTVNDNTCSCMATHHNTRRYTRDFDRSIANYDDCTASQSSHTRR